MEKSGSDYEQVTTSASALHAKKNRIVMRHRVAEVRYAVMFPVADYSGIWKKLKTSAPTILVPASQRL